MPQIVFSKNNLFFYFLLFGYVFGVLLYDFIKFNYTDELMALFLVLFAGITIWERKNVRELYPLFIVGGIFVFYTIYSFIIHSNVPQAILKDLVIQIKPLLGFYCAFLLAPTLDKRQKYILTILCLITGVLLVIVGICDLIDPVFGHSSRFATAATVTALLFFFCSDYSWSDVIVFILLLSIGFFSTRSKFYGFWGVATFLMVYYKMGGIIKLDVKSSLTIIFVTAIALWLSWHKITVYYIDGMMNTKEMWSRPAMLITSFSIFIDYFPFGSGLASFGTFVSGEYYSTIYAEYGIDHLWGISEKMTSFIADAYYPSLAQFGVVGMMLYWLFWISILKSVVNKQKEQPKIFLIAFLLFIFFLIEGTADSTFTHNRGFFLLVLMGITLSKDQIVEQKE